MPKDNSGKGKRTHKTNKNRGLEDDQPVHTPRPPNSWILFRNHFNEQLKLDQQDSKEKLHQHTVSGNASQAWKALSDDERAYWDQKAEEAKAEHLLRYPGYRFRPRRKDQKDDSASPAPSGSMGSQASSSSSTSKSPVEEHHTLGFSAPTRRHLAPRSRPQSDTATSRPTMSSAAASSSPTLPPHLPMTRPQDAFSDAPTDVVGPSPGPGPVVVANDTNQRLARPQRRPFVLPPMPPPIWSPLYSHPPPSWKFSSAPSTEMSDSSQEPSPVDPGSDYTPQGYAPVGWHEPVAGPSNSNFSWTSSVSYGSTSRMHPGVHHQLSPPVLNNTTDTAQTQCRHQDVQGEDAEFEALFDQYINGDAFN